MNATALDLDILLPAFIAGLLVLSTHIPFGMRILQRGVIFADLAVAQIASLGVIAAGLLELGENTLLIQLVAIASALVGAALLYVIERRLQHLREAFIGLTFVLAASAGILLMSRDTHSGEHLQDLLIGQILWVNTEQLFTLALFSATLLLLWRWPRLNQHLFGFYSLFALAVTAAVQLIGVYLVFASLIVPALATHRMSSRMPTAFAVGLSGYACGLMLSVWFDLPAGAAIIWSMAGLALIPASWRRH